MHCCEKIIFICGSKETTSTDNPDSYRERDEVNPLVFVNSFKNENMTPVDWIGSCGVFLILLAYYLNVTSRLRSKHLLFILLNLIGASLACLASYLINYLPFVILEGAWALVSGYALFKYFARDLYKQQ